MNELLAKIQSLLKLGKVLDLILPVAIAASIMIIFVPLAPDIIDVLLAANIATGLVILLTTLFVRRPLDFNIFPSILLATTLFRLVMNIATTRLILTRASEYRDEAAGQVILSFASFVSGDSLVVGLIIFVIIVVIQFVVITKGATRVAEVAARFTLDAMPGKQMAIDADLNAGLITEAEAQKRRQEIMQAADFYGAMDGAGKFVRGDAIAGIVITMINILAGLFIGIVMDGMAFQDALYVFTKLTIGDGLVSQVPALLISIATGLLVTRSSDSTNMPEQFVTQMISRPIVMILTAALLGLLSLSGLPKLPLLTMAGSAIGLALMMSRRAKQEEKVKEDLVAAEEAEKNQKTEDAVEDYLKIDPMELEIGIGLIPLADPGRGGDLLDRIHRLRKEVASEIGIILPRVRIRDSFHLDQLQYRIKIAGQPVAMGMVYPDLYLAMDSGMAAGQVQGLETVDPAFGTPALWIDAATKDQAEIFGYTVVEPGAVIATHLLEVIRKHADEILTRDGTQQLIDELTKAAPAVVGSVIPSVLDLAQVQKVLQLLLREQVAIRQLGAIMEILGEYGRQTKDPFILTEQVRARLARTICTKYRNSEGVLHCVLMDPALEDQIRAGFEYSEHGMFIRLSPNAINNLCQKILTELEKLTQLNMPPVVLVNPQIRLALKHMTSSTIPGLVVLSYNETTPDTQIVSVGVVTL